jgi:hypothetical protein
MYNHSAFGVVQGRGMSVFLLRFSYFSKKDGRLWAVLAIPGSIPGRCKVIIFT